MPDESTSQLSWRYFCSRAVGPGATRCPCGIWVRRDEEEEEEAAPARRLEVEASGAAVAEVDARGAEGKVGATRAFCVCESS